IPSTIVVVRSGMRGDFDMDPASLAPFEHAIAYVPSLDMYLDGTAEYTGSTELPAMDRNSLAVQINEGKPMLGHRPDPPPREGVEAKAWLHGKGKVPQFARKEGDRLSIPVGPAEHLVRDYASLSQRRLDIRLRAQSTDESDWTLHLPAGAKVLNAPTKAEGQS